MSRDDDKFQNTFRRECHQDTEMTFHHCASTRKSVTRRRKTFYRVFVEETLETLFIVSDERNAYLSFVEEIAGKTRHHLPAKCHFLSFCPCERNFLLTKSFLCKDLFKVERKKYGRFRSIEISYYAHYQLFVERYSIYSEIFKRFCIIFGQILYDEFDFMMCETYR